MAMSEQAYEDVDDGSDDIGPTDTNGELVHWMQPKPLSLGPIGISAAAAGAFALGAATAVAVLALLHWLGPERELDTPRRWFRRAD
jgi:hypothetical protein